MADCRAIRWLRRSAVAVVGLALCVLAAGRATTSGAQEAFDEIRGFSPSHAASEADLERKLEAIPEPSHAEADLRHLTAEPHMAGTEASHKIAEWLRDQFRSFGFDSEIVTYSAYLPLPRSVVFNLISPIKEALATPEHALDTEKASDDDRILPAASGYSASGDVTAPIVYANYGSADDYRNLERFGIKVRGKLILVRYGRDYRGVKVKLAEERGAAGVIIYSDPNDDGYRVGEVFPGGPWRPLDGIQRGSVLYTQLYPGDPLTPGLADMSEARRLSTDDAASLPRIPSIAISASDASKIFGRLGGARAPHAWQGGLPLVYRVGPGNMKAHLKVVMDAQERPMYDVIAKMHGVNDDEWVLLGNHHDAWVYGAADPGSGTAAMLETARALGTLTRSGWKPRRTIVIGEWDGEEPGLIGSTKWVQANRAELQAKAVAYINTDVGVTGQNFSASAVPSLREFIRDATRSIADPATGKTLHDAWMGRSSQSSGGLARESRVPVSPLGAGSDFSPFLDYAGVPSIDLSFTGDYGVYHSRYDDFYWMQHFGDRGFIYHAALARVLGVLALRFAEADVVPFDYPDYASDITRAEEDLASRAAGLNGARAALKKISDASAEFSSAAAHAQEAFLSASFDGAIGSKESLIERDFAGVDQAFLTPGGLAGRSWYKHTIFAPGTYTGYSAEILPGISEALDAGDVVRLQHEADSLTAALHRASVRLNGATQVARSLTSSAIEGH